MKNDLHHFLLMHTTAKMGLPTLDQILAIISLLLDEFGPKQHGYTAFELNNKR